MIDRISAVVFIASLGLSGVASADVVNGDFSAGNTGFTNSYTYVTGGYTSPGQYGVVTNPATAFTNGYASYGDHTTGTGQMLFVDGAGSNVSFWSETIGVTPGTNYTLTGWAAAASGMNAPILQFFANGSQIGSDFTLGLNTGVWQQFTAAFNSGAATSINLSFVDANPTPTSAGNDFTVDDISVSAVPLPAAGWLFGSGLLGLIGLSRRRINQG